MSKVRRAGPDENTWREYLQEVSNGKIANFDFDSEPVTVQVENYPYGSQQIIQGRFDYVTEHPFNGSTSETPVEFQFRTGSRLFAIDTLGNSDDLSDIFNAFKSRLPDEIDIAPGLSGSREGLWRFIQAADEVLSVQVVHDGEIVEYDEIEDTPVEEVIGEVMIWEANLVFEHAGSGQPIDVIYDEESLFIRSDLEGDAEYILQILEREVFGGE